MQFELLNWDTHFFGFPVGRVSSPISCDEMEEVLARAKSLGIRLLYAAVSSSDQKSIHACEAHGGCLVDQKLTYVRVLPKTSKPLVVGHQVELLLPPVNKLLEQQLIELSWEAATYSRFRLDTQMPPGIWQKMYSEWIINSLNHQIADSVLVVRKEEQIAGMITVSHKDPVGSIGLLAVSTLFRGQGIAKRLISSAEDLSIQNSCHSIKVITQGVNRSACSAYERAGFSISLVEIVFHFWI